MADSVTLALRDAAASATPFDVVILDIKIAGKIPGVLGSAIIAGRATEILDVGHYLPLAFEDWLTWKGGRPDRPPLRVLLIDDECADLSDHVTGKHVQFMVLLEAARQMGNAVTQKFHSTAAKMYLAENINVDFKAFAYPFQVDLEYRVLERNLRTTGDGKMAVRIDFRQQGKVIAQLTLTFTVPNSSYTFVGSSSNAVWNATGCGPVCVVSGGALGNALPPASTGS